MLAFKFPKATDEEKAQRAAAIELATKGAAEVPMRTAETALRVLELLSKLAEIGIEMLFQILRSARRWRKPPCAELSITSQQNLGSLKDEAFKAEYRTHGLALVKKAEESASKIERAFLTETLAALNGLSISHHVLL